MAYQTRHKDPLLDSAMQDALRQRSREFTAAGLLLVAALIALMLFSYTPEDPNILAATEADPQNFLGRFGATISMLLLTIIGVASWSVVAALVVWGVRLLMRRGDERMLTCALFVLPFVMICAVFASSHVPPADWPQESIGMGGLFGDTLLQLFVQLLPLPAGAAVKVISLLSLFGMVALGALSFGVDRDEAFFIKGFFLGGVKTLQELKSGTSKPAAPAPFEPTPRAAPAEPIQPKGFSPYRPTPPLQAGPIHERDVLYPSEEFVEPEPEVEPEAPLEQKGIFAHFRRPTAPVFEETAPVEAEVEDDAAYDEEAAYIDEDRVKARITSAIQSRVRRGEPVAPPATRVEEMVEPEVYVEPEKPAKKSPFSFSLPKLGGKQPLLRSAPPLTARAEPKLTGSMDDHPEEPQEIASFAADMPVFSTRQAVADPYQEDTHFVSVDETDPYADPSYAPLPEPDDEPIRLEAPTRVPLAEEPSFTPDPQVPVMPIPQAEPLRKVQHAPAPLARPSKQAERDAQPAFAFEPQTQPTYELPSLSLLKDHRTIERQYLSDEALEENARMLETVLDDYGVKGEIVSVRPGPVVTMYELEPAPGLKASRVIGLADDIARSMSALSARVSTVPGRTIIGIELPNDHREVVLLREILAHRDFGDTTQKLPLALGKDIGGAPVVANLAKMPHLLIAGTTGSGKSVAINTMILSLLYKLTPEDCRLIMIDPKMLELSVYDGIPHLLSPVVTDPKKAVVALKWVVGEMEERYRKMSKMGVRNIDGYNSRVSDTLEKGEMFKRTVQTGFDDETGEPVFETEEIQPEKLPYIVVIVDEMADLMMVAGKEIEACIQRLAQMARASGIHLVMATQRPSVDVITGTIKANFPTRISFHVTSKVDSRTILGEQGAEQLLGMGDMLYMAGGSKITRVHGPFCSDEEVEEIVNHLKSFGPPDYATSVLDGPDEEKAGGIDEVLGLGGNTTGEDALYDQAVAIVAKDRKCSTSYIQRKLGIGYNKAARLVEQMEEQGLVSSANQVGKREILIPDPAA